VVACHYRWRDGSGWSYFPKGAEKRLAWVIGELGAGVGYVTAWESQWDCFTYMDLSGEKSGHIVTRGKSNGRLVAGLLPPATILYIFPQNDESGRQWAMDVFANRVGPVYRVKTPGQYKDLNEWRKAGATANDLLEAMRNAELNPAPEPPIEEEIKVDITAGDEPEEEEEDEPEEQPPPFPIECLPEIPRRMVEAISKLTGTPFSMSGPMVLGAGSLSIGKGLQVRGPRYVTAANLYTLVCKVSGSGGSKTFEHAVKPIVGAQKTYRREFEELEKPRIDAELKDISAQIGNLDKDLKDKKVKGPEQREEIKTKITKLNIRKSKLEKRKGTLLFVTDATPESMVGLMSNSPEETLAQIDSDAGGALAIIKGERYNKKSDINAGLSFYLKAWSKEPISQARKSTDGGKPQHVEEPCLTILFVATPSDVQAFFKDPLLNASGLLPRFLVCDPKARPVPMDLNSDDASIPFTLPSDAYEPYKGAIFALISRYRLFKTKIEEASDNDGSETEPEPSRIGMTAGARHLVEEDWNGFVGRCDDGKDHPYESRHTENGIRLALVLHAFHCIRRVKQSDGTFHSEACAHEHPIDEATMRDALRLRDWFNWHQQRFLVAQQAADEGRVWGRMKTILNERSSAVGVTKRDLWRRGVFSSRDEESRCLEQWVKERWIERFTRETTRRGGRPTFAYREIIRRHQ